MTTISVSLSSTLLRHIQALVDRGIASNKEAVIRKALKKFVEDQAVEAVLQARKEPRLKGDLDILAKRFA